MEAVHHQEKKNSFAMRTENEIIPSAQTPEVANLKECLLVITKGYCCDS